MLTTRIVGNVRNIGRYLPPVTTPNASNSAKKTLPMSLNLGALFSDCKVSRVNDSLVQIDGNKKTSMGTTTCWSMGSGNRCCYGCAN